MKNIITIRQTLIQTSVRYQYHPIRVVERKNADKELKLSYIADKNAKRYSHSEKWFCDFV